MFADEDLLVAREVAAVLRVKVTTIYAAAAAGRLPCIRLWRGRRKSLVRFRRADIEALIAGGASASEPAGRATSRR
jgi:excisionase family DNA binding protein